MRQFALFAIIVGITTPVQAAEITNMFIMPGFCEQLRVDNKPVAGCENKIMQVVYDSGRASLVAVAEGDVYSFSGTEQRVRNGKIYQGLDQVTIATASGTQNHTVTGLCEFEDPFAGAASFTCKAHGDDGIIYNLVFATDGTPPEDSMAD
ncbi:hypothetical protein [Devosia sp. SL43]|uniref:hypothetical protein n=1 Tax=Devosia sp. SL43 TaxID=2806348 RepID=UPI001F326ED2|nr:hypothetical protein [Devosia sp. SL43]UJW86980.1 hypothetical protein IM737_06980 [Devosia sp. SL43]